MIWLMLCFFIDGTDGLMARKFRVQETLPFMDGKNIDFVIDFLSYAFIPACFIYRSDLVDANLRFPVAAFVIMTSAIYYGKKGMVSTVKQFTGFPVLWNLVVFYTFFIFRSGPTVNLMIIIAFGILHFVPIQVSYPSANLKKNPLPFILGTAMMGVFIYILKIFPEEYTILTFVSLAAFAYFIYLTIKYTWQYLKGEMPSKEILE